MGGTEVTYEAMKAFVEQHGSEAAKSSEWLKDSVRATIRSKLKLRVRIATVEFNHFASRQPTRTLICFYASNDDVFDIEALAAMPVPEKFLQVAEHIEVKGGICRIVASEGFVY